MLTLNTSSLRSHYHSAPSQNLTLIRRTSAQSSSSVLSFSIGVMDSSAAPSGQIMAVDDISDDYFESHTQPIPLLFEHQLEDGRTEYEVIPIRASTAVFDPLSFEVDSSQTTGRLKSFRMKDLPSSYRLERVGTKRNADEGSRILSAFKTHARKVREAAKVLENKFSEIKTDVSSDLAHTIHACDVYSADIPSAAVNYMADVREFHQNKSEIGKPKDSLDNMTIDLLNLDAELAELAGRYPCNHSPCLGHTQHLHDAMVYSCNSDMNYWPEGATMDSAPVWQELDNRSKYLASQWSVSGFQKTLHRLQKNQQRPPVRSFSQPSDVKDVRLAADWMKGTFESFSQSPLWGLVPKPATSIGATINSSTVGPGSGGAPSTPALPKNHHESATATSERPGISAISAIKTHDKGFGSLPKTTSQGLTSASVPQTSAADSTATVRFSLYGEGDEPPAPKRSHPAGLEIGCEGLPRSETSSNPTTPSLRQLLKVTNTGRKKKPKRPSQPEAPPTIPRLPESLPTPSKQGGSAEPSETGTSVFCSKTSSASAKQRRGRGRPVRSGESASKLDEMGSHLNLGTNASMSSIHVPDRPLPLLRHPPRWEPMESSEVDVRITPDVSRAKWESFRGAGAASTDSQNHQPSHMSLSTGTPTIESGPNEIAESFGQDRSREGSPDGSAHLIQPSPTIEGLSDSTVTWHRPRRTSEPDRLTDFYGVHGLPIDSDEERELQPERSKPRSSSVPVTREADQ